MGRIADLCSEIAAAADETEDGLVLPADARDKLRAEWPDADIDDALSLVAAQSMLNVLVEVADSMSARLLELLGTWGEPKGWTAAVEGHASVSVDEIRQLAHRLDSLEEILEFFRDEEGPDRRGFDRLQRRLMDQGIEEEMRPDWDRVPGAAGSRGEMLAGRLRTVGENARPETAEGRRDDDEPARPAREKRPRGGRGDEP